MYIFRFLHFGDFNNSLSVQLLGGNNINVGRGDIMLNFLWLLIFYSGIVDKEFSSRLTDFVH